MEIAHKKFAILGLDKATVFRLCSTVINITCTYCSDFQLSVMLNSYPP